ncbi:MAG: hypothetical protein KZQ83_17225 [gamma proteobacterium symbiont of Taylorina sp.]|nr:hypothetical protein [gamma proteobacterium symbiont of Taylorina sp.]
MKIKQSKLFLILILMLISNTCLALENLFGIINVIDPEENTLLIDHKAYRFNPGKINVQMQNKKVDMENLKPDMQIEYKVQANQVYFVKILYPDRANHYNLKQ